MSEENESVYISMYFLSEEMQHNVIMFYFI